jgi:hypothetical protein
MNDDDDRLRKALRDAMHRADTAGPARDLWPELRRRLQAQPPPLSRLDWALLAALVAYCVVFPEGLVTLLYHL